MVLGVSTIARRRLNRKAAADRRYVAIVIGEYERAFYGNQYASMAPLLEHYGIQLWLPGAGAPVDKSEPLDRLGGGQSQALPGVLDCHRDGGADG
jgi:hypothetical protein